MNPAQASAQGTSLIDAWRTELQQRGQELPPPLLEYEAAGKPWQPRHIAALSAVLEQQGKSRRALQLAQCLSVSHPQNLGAWRRLGRLANQQQDWPQAAQALERALSLADDASRDQIAGALAQAWLKTLPLFNAIERVQSLLRTQPHNQRLLRTLAQACATSGRHQDVLALAEQYRAQWSEHMVAVFAAEISACARSCQPEQVRLRLSELITRCSHPDQLALINAQLNYLGNVASRAPFIQQLEDKTRALARQFQTDEAQLLLAEQELRLCLMRYDFALFLQALDRTQARGLSPSTVFPQIADSLRTKPERRAKIFGVGLSKTGTTSVEAALQILGFRAAHFLHPATRMMLEEQDWSLFDALNDTPIAYDFERCYAQYPQAKFIYTIRPFESWKKSLLNHFRSQRGCDDWTELQRRNAQTWARLPEIEGKLYFQHPSPEAAWEAHDAHVRRFFADKPADQFLVFDVVSGDSWQKLCDFLRLDVPAQAFPAQNKGKLLT